MDGDDFKTHYGAQTTVGADNCTGEMSYVTARRHRGEPGGVMSLRIGGVIRCRRAIPWRRRRSRRREPRDAGRCAGTPPPADDIPFP